MELAWSMHATKHRFLVLIVGNEDWQSKIPCKLVFTNNFYYHTYGSTLYKVHELS